MGKSRFARGIISLVLLLISILAVFIICALVFLVLFGTNFRDKSYEEDESFTYRYRRINPTQNHSSSGFMHMRKRIEEEGEFYRQNDGSYVLISNFGTPEYECTGSCLCLEGNEESGQGRRKSSVLVNGMVFLVAALSSIVALDRAKDYFEDECAKNLDDEKCSFEHVSSVVEDCQEMYDEDFVDEYRDVDTVASKMLDFTGHHVYRCYGRCYDFKPLLKGIGYDPINVWFKSEHPKVEKAYEESFTRFKEEKKGECKDLVLEKEMLQVPGWSLESLKISFIFAELRYFCDQNSMFRVVFPEDLGGSIPTYFCVSVDQEVLDEIVMSQIDFSDEDKMSFIMDLVDMGIVLDVNIENELDKTIWDPLLMNPSVECHYSREYDPSKAYSENLKTTE